MGIPDGYWVGLWIVGVVLFVMLLFHLVVALLSTLLSTYTALFPSKIKIKLSVFSILPVLSTGVALVVKTGIPFGRICLPGLGYIVFVTITSLVGRKRLSEVT